MNFEIKFPFSAAAARIYENDVNPNMVIYLLIKTIDRQIFSIYLDGQIEGWINVYPNIVIYSLIKTIPLQGQERDTFFNNFYIKNCLSNIVYKK